MTSKSSSSSKSSSKNESPINKKEMYEHALRINDEIIEIGLDTYPHTRIISERYETFEEYNGRLENTKQKRKKETPTHVLRTYEMESTKGKGESKEKVKKTVTVKSIVTYSIDFTSGLEIFIKRCASDLKQISSTEVIKEKNCKTDIIEATEESNLVTPNILSGVIMYVSQFKPEEKVMESEIQKYIILHSDNFSSIDGKVINKIGTIIGKYVAACNRTIVLNKHESMQSTLKIDVLLNPLRRIGLEYRDRYPNLTKKLFEAIAEVETENREAIEYRKLTSKKKEKKSSDKKEEGDDDGKIEETIGSDEDESPDEDLIDSIINGEDD